MAQDHADLLARAASVFSPSPLREHGGQRYREPHVVVATQNLPRMSGAIQALIKAGYRVTAYASPTRLLPRLHRLGSQPVSLLVIDGGLTPAFARAAAIAARSIYTGLPILLLAPAHATRCTEFMPAGVSVLRLPVVDTHLLGAADRLAPRLIV